MRRGLSQIEQCFIGTIHSFCARLLRERPVEAGVDLAFEELDQDADLRLRNEAWDEFETAKGRTPDDPNPYYGLAEVARYRGEEKLASDYYLEYLELGGQEKTKRQRAIDWLWDHGRGAEIPK